MKGGSRLSRGTETVMARPSASSDLEAAARAAERGQRVVLQRGSGPSIAVVPAEDLDLIEELERREDADLLAASLAAEAVDAGKAPEAWDAVKRRLGLE